MKKSKVIIFTCVLLLCTIIASAAYANDLTSKEEQYILNTFTTWCRNIGCDGLYDTEFHSLSRDLNEEECSLTLTFLSYYHYHKDRFIEGPVSIECSLGINSIEILSIDKDLFIEQNYLINQISECMGDQRMLLDNK